MRPRVADFGLAKTLQIEDVNSGAGGVAMSRVAGTHGYIAPARIVWEWRWDGISLKFFRKTEGNTTLLK
ncbi:hypothetical protein V6N13_074093 [Hibiscus sabdariffa]